MGSYLINPQKWKSEQEKSLDWDCETRDHCLFVWLPKRATKAIKLVIKI